jgi:hypothetical protein
VILSYPVPSWSNIGILRGVEILCSRCPHRHVGPAPSGSQSTIHDLFPEMVWWGDVLSHTKRFSLIASCTQEITKRWVFRVSEDLSLLSLYIHHRHPPRPHFPCRPGGGALPFRVDGTQSRGKHLPSLSSIQLEFTATTASGFLLRSVRRSERKNNLGSFSDESNLRRLRLDVLTWVWIRMNPRPAVAAATPEQEHRKKRSAKFCLLLFPFPAWLSYKSVARADRSPSSIRQRLNFLFFSLPLLSLEDTVSRRRRERFHPLSSCPKFARRFMRISVSCCSHHICSVLWAKFRADLNHFPNPCIPACTRNREHEKRKSFAVCFSRRKNSFRLFHQRIRCICSFIDLGKDKKGKSR